MQKPQRRPFLRTMMNKNIHILPGPQQAASALAAVLYHLSKVMLMNKPSLSLAVSGGNSPILLFKELAANYTRKFEWKKIHFYWVDERCVPPTDKESNYGSANRFLLEQIPVPPSNIHRIMGEDDPAAEAKRYSDELKANLPHTNGFPALDVVLLGLGTDGHTASIFPGQTNLISSPEAVATSVNPSGQQRITLTGKTINNASTVFFLVTGKDKSEILASVIAKQKGSEAYPARHIKPVSGNLNWYLDKEAAASL